MKPTSIAPVMLLALTAVLSLFGSAASASDLKVLSNNTVTDVKFPESVAYDPKAKVFYVSEFGSALKPTEKDGQGYISKVSMTGEILEQKFLPTGDTILNKPKGIWVKGNRLWVTDIDSVWVFDLKTREGRKVELPGIQFANDPTLVGKSLVVSDNRGDQMYRVTPADFLNSKTEPKVEVIMQNAGVNPNGVFPDRRKSVLTVGFKSADDVRGIYRITVDGSVETVQPPFGQLDGIYRFKDGSLLVTDWKTGSLIHWQDAGVMTPLADGFKGPADFAVAPTRNGYLVVIPELVASQLRFIELSK